VENGRGECQPAQKLVTPHRKGTRRASPRPHRQDAEDQAASDCAKAQDLRNLPRCAQRCHGLVGAYTADTEALFGLVVGSKDLSVRLVRAIRACHRSVPARPFRA
jgi:hypothetical protein